MEDFKERAMAAEVLWLSGNLEGAEKSYLDLIASLDESDRGLAGGLHINLGLIAEKANRLREAVAYYEQAISILDGMDGESGLQCAHSHYNIARLLRGVRDDRYEAYARKAIERYQASPLASDTDIKDAEKLLKSPKIPRASLLVGVLIVIAVAVWLLFF